MPLACASQACGVAGAVACITAFMGLQAFAYAGFHAYIQVDPLQDFSFAQLAGCMAPMLLPGLVSQPDVRCSHAVEGQVTGLRLLLNNPGRTCCTTQRRHKDTMCKKVLRRPSTCHLDQVRGDTTPVRAAPLCELRRTWRRAAQARCWG